jgi:hypothetical protein
MKHRPEVQRDAVMQPASVRKHLDRAFGTGHLVHSDEAVFKRWPIGVVSDEVLLLECLAQCCDDLTGFMIVDLGKEVDVFRRPGGQSRARSWLHPRPSPTCGIAARPARFARFVPAADPGACG